jgi:hypothetical protein
MSERGNDAARATVAVGCEVCLTAIICLLVAVAPPEQGHQSA